MTIIFLALVHLLLASPASAAPRAVHTGSTLQTAYANWMRWLPDSTPLSVLSVPGTHDTMARYGGPAAETQTLPLLEQLRAGIRTLDIRARHIQDRFAIHHGPYYQNVMFGDVLIDCNTFLSQNPTETIVLWLSDSGVPDEQDCTRTFAQTFSWYRDQSGLGSRIFSPSAFTPFSTPIGQLRGKIVMIWDLEDNQSCQGCGWHGTSVYQNLSPSVETIFHIPAKWEAFVVQAALIDSGSATRLYENSLTGSSGLFPIDLANGVAGYEGMNYRYLPFLLTGNHRRTTGLMYLDFPGSGLIAAMLAHNMKFATNVSALASDFPRVLNDISYSATHEGIDGSVDHARQIKVFLQHILPAQRWSVLVSSFPGNDSWGVALEPDGLSAQSQVIDGFTHVAVSSRNLDPALASINLAGFWTPATLTALSGNAAARANGAQSLLKAQFPQARWNVGVKRIPFDVANWATDLDAAVSSTVLVTDDGWIYSYTAWATSSTNRPPIAQPGGPYQVNEGVPVTFDASQSSDPTDDVLQYRWDFDGDGTWDTDYSFEPTITHIFTDTPVTSPRLEVFDGALSANEKVSVNVLNVTPTVEVPARLVLGSDRTLSREFTIADTGADSWTVDVSFGDGTPRVTPTLVGRTFTLNHQFPASGYFEVTVEVRDDDDAESISRFRVITGAPVLDLKKLNATTARVSWSNHPAPFRLETSTQPSAFNWQVVPGLPTLLSGRQQMDISSTNAAAFFRLALP